MDSAYSVGNYQEAKSASDTARTLNYVGIGIGIFLVVIYVICIGIGAATSSA